MSSSNAHASTTPKSNKESLFVAVESQPSTHKTRKKERSTTPNKNTSSRDGKANKKCPGKASSSSTSDQRSSSNSPTESIVTPSKSKFPGGTESKKRLFLPSLYQMCNTDPDNECISWSKDGKVFWVTNSEVFSRRVLPKYFRHNNYASFVRQLNMYGFQRSTETKGQVEQGAPMVEHFSHEHFIRGHEKGLVNIHRKTSSFMKANALNKRGLSDSKDHSERLDKLESAMARQIDTQSQMLKEVVELRNNQVIMQNTLAMMQNTATIGNLRPLHAMFEHTNKRSRPSAVDDLDRLDAHNKYDSNDPKPVPQFQQPSVSAAQGPNTTAVDSPANFEAVQTLLTLVQPSNRRRNSVPTNYSDQ